MTNITAKLILNVGHHGLAMRKIFHSRSSKTALNSSVLPYDFTKKTSDLYFIPGLDKGSYKGLHQELCTSLENILN